MSPDRNAEALSDEDLYKEVVNRLIQGVAPNPESSKGSSKYTFLIEGGGVLPIDLIEISIEEPPFPSEEQLYYMGFWAAGLHEREQMMALLSRWPDEAGGPPATSLILGDHDWEIEKFPTRQVLENIEQLHSEGKIKPEYEQTKTELAPIDPEQAVRASMSPDRKLEPITPEDRFKEVVHELIDNVAPDPELGVFNRPAYTFKVTGFSSLLPVDEITVSLVTPDNRAEDDDYMVDLSYDGQDIVTLHYIRGEDPSDTPRASVMIGEDPRSRPIEEPGILIAFLDALAQAKQAGYLTPTQSLAKEEPQPLGPSSPEQAARIKLFEKWQDLAKKLVDRFKLNPVDDAWVNEAKIGARNYNGIIIQANFSSRVGILARLHTELLEERPSGVKVYRHEDRNFHLLPDGTITVSIDYSLATDYGEGVESLNLDSQDFQYLPGDVLPPEIMDFLQKGPRVIAKLPNEAFKT